MIIRKEKMKVEIQTIDTMMMTTIEAPTKAQIPMMMIQTIRRLGLLQRNVFKQEAHAQEDSLVPLHQVQVTGRYKPALARSSLTSSPQHRSRIKMTLMTFPTTMLPYEKRARSLKRRGRILKPVISRMTLAL
jgi:hypothetical protein